LFTGVVVLKIPVTSFNSFSRPYTDVFNWRLPTKVRRKSPIHCSHRFFFQSTHVPFCNSDAIFHNCSLSAIDSGSR